MKTLVGPLVLLLCIAISAAGFNNVMGDMGPVLRAAEAKACEGAGPKCRANLAGGYSRSPFANEFSMRAAGKPLKVRCARTYIFVGDWSCVRL